MEKQQGSKYKVLYNIFNAGGERRKTGNPQNQRIDGWYDNAPRVLANQLCALSLGEQSVANVERAESFPLPPSFFFPSPPPPPSPFSLPLHGPAFICPPSFCTSNAISAVNAGCARRRGIIMAACALARLMRSGKIRPSVCARPSDAC